MRTLHLIAALALVVGKSKADDDGMCGVGLAWDNDGPGFPGDDGITVSCAEIGAYADSIGALSPNACVDPMLSGNSVEPDADTTNIWLLIDMGGCCGVDGYSRCTADPRGICADPDMWNGEAIVEPVDQSCNMLAAFLSTPNAPEPAINEGEQFQDSCATCASSYMQMFDLSTYCCGGEPVVCSGQIDYSCFDEGSGSGSGSGSGGGEPSEQCMTGCITDCYGNDDFLQGGRWNKEQCVCLVTDCYDDTYDCNDDDVKFIEDFVGTGCGAEDSSYDYSYDYRNVEDIAEEEGEGEGDGVARAALASAAVVVGAALLF